MMQYSMKNRSGWFAAVLAAGSLMFTACAGAQPEADNDVAGQPQDQISIGAVQGLSGNIGMAYLYEYVLEDSGYDVEVQQMVDVAPVYAAVAAGDLDLYAAAWPEHAQEVYWKEHQDDLEDLGVIYDDAKLFLAVPEYSDIRSIPELPEYADDLGGQITGIEPGAGLSVMTEEDIMPHYGLEEDFDLELSSTSGMIDALDQAVEEEHDIVVTLWTPFEASVEHPMRALDDPDNIYGDAEGIHTVGRFGFAGDFPEVASMVENLSLTSEEYAELEHLIVNETDDEDQAAAVHTWIDDHPEIVEQMVEELQNP